MTPREAADEERVPAIAVVMPVRNRAGSVRRAIDSVLGQDFADFELIVVDDASDDGTPEAVAAVADPRVRCLRQPRHLGANAARNRGIRAAESPLVAFLDSDDAYLPGKLRFVVGVFTQNPELDALIDSFRLTWPSGMRRAPVERINPALGSSGEVREAAFARRLWKATPAISARRAALLSAGLFDETLARRQDMDLILRLAAAGRVASTPDVLWVKRWSAEAISAKQETFLEATLALCERHPDYLERPEYRRGLARDVARHFARLLGRGRIAAVRADLARCRAGFGRRRTAALIGAGSFEMLRRALGR